MTFYITQCTTVGFLLETEWPSVILIWHGIVFLNSWISYIYHWFLWIKIVFPTPKQNFQSVNLNRKLSCFCGDRNERTCTWILPKILNSKSSVKWNLYVRTEVSTTAQVCTKLYNIIPRRTEFSNLYVHTGVVQ